MQKRSLKELAVEFFETQGYKVTEDEIVKSKYSIDLLIKEREDILHGVVVKDWKRTVGVNVLLRLDRAISKAGLQQGIVVGPSFSSHARSYANKRKIKLITYSEVRKHLHLY
ncbi:MAG: restriction endonuclease [Candidatus Hodarchaeota archaeon]